MIKRLSMLLALLLIMAAPALADSATPEWEEPVVLVASVERMLAGGQFIPGLEPGMSVEAVRAAGIPLAQEPMGEHESEDGLVKGVNYALDDDALVICNRELMAGPYLQFENGMLISVSLTITDSWAAEEMREHMAELLGAPETKAIEDQRLSADTWYIGEGGAQARLGLILQWKDNAIERGSLQLGYPGLLEEIRANASPEK